MNGLIPNVPNMYDIRDLFANFGLNFSTISPALFIVLGVFFASYCAKKIKNLYF